MPDATTTDVWTAAFSTAGASVWTNTLGGPGRDLAQGVALIGGRVVVGGEFEQTVDFDAGPGTAARTSAGASDGFVALYDAATGAFVQAEALGGPGADQAYAVGGGAARGLVGGAFSDTADLAPTPGETDPRTAVAAPDAFVAVYFPDGRAARFTVTTAADAGPGSFRQALLDAGTNGGGTVAFNIPGAGPHAITLATLLAPVAAPVVIDGFTQPGASPNAAGPWEPTNAAIGIEIDGRGVAAAGSGLVLRGGASTVRGLAIGGFQQHGVVLEGQAGNVVEGCNIGTDASGATARRNAFSAVFVLQSGQARIGGGAAAARNVLSGNGSYGVIVYGAGASGTAVQGNFIGTNAAGTAALANGSSGVVTGSTVVFNDPSPSEALDVRIGGAAPGEGNLISGHGAFGVEVYGFAPTGTATTLGDTRLEGNRIGTDAAGAAAIPNTLAGVLVRRNPTGVTIGGAAAGAGNVVSGNADDGIIVEISDGVVVENNLVGTDATGTRPLGNRQSGILLFCSRNAVVRGNVAAANGTGTGDSVGGGIGGTCTSPNFQGSGNLTALQRPTRDEQRQAGAAGAIGVNIGGDVRALRRRAVHQRQHGGGVALLRPLRLDMGDDGDHPRRPADRQRLAHALERAVILLRPQPLVVGEDGAPAARGGQYAHHLVRIGVIARLVIQPGRDAPGARRQVAVNQPPHRRDLRRARPPVLIAYGGLPDGVETDHEAEVFRQPLCTEGGELAGNIGRPAAVGVADLGRDALGEHVDGGGHRVGLSVAVNVDEPRRDRHSLRLDHHRRLRVLEVTNRRDPVRDDADIADPRGQAAAVDEKAVADDDVIARRFSRRRGAD